MKIKDIMAIVAVAVMTGSCNSTDEAQQDERVPIMLSASIEGSKTRTRTDTGAHTQDTELLAGQAVDVYIKKSDGTFLANPLNCTVANANGDLTYSGDYYYPMDGTPVTIYAVHPSYTSATDFTVRSNQMDADNYAASDLCYCASNTYKRQEAAHDLTFNHVMSKIIVKVDVSGLGMEEADAPDVTNLKLWAKTKTTLTYPYPSDATNDYLLGEASTPGYVAMNEGGAVIIPPQTVAADGDVRIAFDVEGIGPIAYDFPADTEFASNTEYTYTVNVGSAITVTSSINPWGSDDGSPADPANTYTGNVTPNYLDYDNMTLSIGDILFADGSVTSTTVTDNDIAAHGVPVGIIVYVYNSNDAFADGATEKGVVPSRTPGGHALVMSLRNTLDGVLPWDRTGVLFSEPQFSGIVTASYPGYARTKGMVDACVEPVTDVSTCLYPAAYSAYSYTELPAPLGTTGWFLPSMGQWNLVLRGLTTISYDLNHVGTHSRTPAYSSSTLMTQVNDKLARAGEGNYTPFPIAPSTATNYYTSSESSLNNENRIWIFAIGSQGVRLDHCPRSQTNNVRPFLAF